MATLYAYKAGLLRRVHEWAADHFRFVQYPRPQVQVRRVIERRSDWTMTTLKWMALGLGLWLIWGPLLLISLCVAVALLG